MQLQSLVLLFHLELEMELAHVTTWLSNVTLMPYNHSPSFVSSTAYSIYQMLILYNLNDSTMR
jgi:hypothetical protein